MIIGVDRHDVRVGQQESCDNLINTSVQCMLYKYLIMYIQNISGNENINKLINPDGDLNTITHMDKSYLLNIVLYGSPNLTLEINTRLIHVVQTFITEGGRFHNK